MQPACNVTKGPGEAVAIPVERAVSASWQQPGEKPAAGQLGLERDAAPEIQNFPAAGKVGSRRGIRTPPDWNVVQRLK